MSSKNDHTHVDIKKGDLDLNVVVDPEKHPCHKHQHHKCHPHCPYHRDHRRHGETGHHCNRHCPKHPDHNCDCGGFGCETRMPTPSKLKVVAVGDPCCGKTCLLLSFAKDYFSDSFDTFVLDNFETDIQLDQKSYELALWDTAGQEDYDRLRQLSYPETSVVLICFGIDNHVALENVTSKWAPEISHFCPGVPIILVGTKNDLRHDAEVREFLARSEMCPVRTEEANKVKDRIGAYAYVECSAKLKEGVREVFETAIRASRTQRQQKKKPNSICKIS